MQLSSETGRTDSLHVGPLTATISRTEREADNLAASRPINSSFVSNRLLESDLAARRRFRFAAIDALMANPDNVWQSLALKRSS